MNYGRCAIGILAVALLFSCTLIQPAIAYNSSIPGSGEVEVTVHVYQWPIHSGSTTGGDDIQQMLEAENGNTFSGELDGSSVAFLPSANNIFNGRYPSAYIYLDDSKNTNKDLSLRGETFKVTFKVPTSMAFGLRIKGNNSSTVNVSVVSENGTVFQGSNNSNVYTANNTAAYFGASSTTITQNKTTSTADSALRWFSVADMSGLGDYLTITLSGTMSNNRGTNLQCQIYYGANA